MQEDLFSPFGIVNRYDERCAYVWLKFISIASEIEEVEPDYVVGERPGWLDEEIGNLDWKGIVFQQFEDNSELRDDEGRLARNGLAPEQPFLVRVDRPRYFQIGSPSDGYDWDAEIDAEIVAVQPWSSGKVVEAYAAEFERCGLNRLIGDVS